MRLGVHHIDPEAKKQSMQWKHPGSPPPKKYKRVPSAGKVMASVFWDKECILCRRTKAAASRDCEEKKRKVDWKCSALARKCTSPHISSCYGYCNKMQLRGPSSSPVSSRCSSFYLFMNLKAYLHGRNFGRNGGIIDAVDEYLEDQNEGFYFEGISKLEKLWRKCIEAEGDDVEK